MTARALGEGTGALLPATLAARVSFALGFALVALETATGALWTAELRLLYWALTALLAVLAFLPQIPERTRGMIVVGTWLSAGWFSLLVAGLREGFVILATTVALAGGFVGLRGALFVIGTSAAWAAIMGWLHVQGLAGSPARYTATDQPDAWVLGIATFSGLSLMASVVQSRLAAAVQASSARARAFATVAERSTSAIAFTDLSRSIVWVNDAFVTLTGYTAEEARGRTPGALLQGEGTPPRDRATMREALAAARPCRLDTVNYRKDGTPYWVRVDLRPFHDEGGVLRGFTGSQLDVTAERLGAQLDDIERRLLSDFAGAENASFHDALVRNLRRCELVRFARVWVRQEEELCLVAAAQPDGPQGSDPPPAQLGRLPSLPHGEVVSDPGEPPDARTERLLSRLEGGQQGMLEVGVWRFMPGREALLRRLPSLVELHGLFQQRRADEEHLEDIFARSPEALLVLGPGERVLQLNDEAARLLPRVEVGCVLTERHPELGPALLRAPSEPPSPSSPEDPRQSRPGGGRRSLSGAVRRAGSGAPPVSPTWKVELSPGKTAELEVHLGTGRRPGGVETLVAIRDVTERVRQLEATRLALREKETLLKEVHHRVKNNLQIVSSLLDMQMASARDPESMPSLRESGLRVRSMALVHQALYGHDSLARVDFGQYVRDLARGVQGSLRPDVRVDVRADEIEIAMDRAVPLGLALNELLTNSFKYGIPAASPPASPPAIVVTWTAHAGQFRLAVIDQGPGLERAPDASTQSLGLRLVLNLTRQVGGAFAHRRTEAGSVFEISGPVDEAPAQPPSRP
jgi:PAS domain S-box-containing protein